MNIDELGSGEERMLRAKLKYEYKLLHIAEESNDEEKMLKHQANIVSYESQLEK
jgi:hypothetical protein